MEGKRDRFMNIILVFFGLVILTILLYPRNLLGEPANDG